jgi:DNA-binding MarR family transcriptional regulator
MTDPDRNNDQRYSDALELVEFIVMAFDIETKGEGGRNSGAIGMSGCRVFNILAKKPGAFVGLVPLRYSDLAEESGLSSSTIDRAVDRLIEHLLISVIDGSGQSTGRMALLHLPPRVLSLYERRERRPASGSCPVPRAEVAKALALLSKEV